MIKLSDLLKSKSLGKRLLSNMVLMATIPLLLLSSISYLYVSSEVKNITRKDLRDLSLVRAQSVNQYFEGVLQDINSESDRQSNVELLGQLQASYQQSNKPLSEFVKSYRWSIIVDELSQDVEQFWKTYGYTDVKLLDLNGNILFSADRAKDLGLNLLNDAYVDSNLSKSFSKALATGNTSFSDLGYFMDKSKISGFFVNSLINEDGDKIGALVIEIEAETIDQLMKDNRRLENSVGKEMYLLGLDRILRTNTRSYENDRLLTVKIESAEIEKWFNKYTNSDQDIGDSQQEINYINIHGKNVVAVLTAIDIAEVIWVVVVEIESQIAYQAVSTLINIFVSLTVISSLVIWLSAVPITRKIVSPILEISNSVKQAGAGNLDVKVKIKDQSEIGVLADGYNQMLIRLKFNKKQLEEREWFEQGVLKMNDLMRGAQDKYGLAEGLLNYIIKYIDAQVGTFYWVEEEQLSLVASYGLKNSDTHENVEQSDGLLGQVALSQQAIKIIDIPDDYLSISSSLGSSPAKSILIFPFAYNDDLLAIIELAWISAIPEKAIALLDKSSENVAITLITINQRDHVLKMLTESQNQSKELQAQQEELRVTNEVLSENSKRLKEQQEYLEQARQDSEEKAKEIEEASKYKSEFLANMSHELRTPLNSLLILARSLADNDDNNLSEDEVESAQVIQQSGQSLLELINEILDLSKVEAGQMTLIAEDVRLQDFALGMNSRFKHMAEDKNIGFEIQLDEDLPETITTDGIKVGQILNNLISNALKFTAQGKVVLSIAIRHGEGFLSGHSDVVEFSVQDTGIGIPLDKQAAVFEAFQQADGTTSRTHGGTGLGLSIALSFSRLLGGDLKLISTVNQGSTFSLYLPVIHRLIENFSNPTANPDESIGLNLVQQKSQVKTRMLVDEMELIDITSITVKPPPFKDDRDCILPSKRLILVIEDDPKFAKILARVCHKQNCQVIVAPDGESGLALATQYPISGIILDYTLPGMNGAEVLHNIRHHPKTSQIQVHIISALDNIEGIPKHHATEKAVKPVTTEQLVHIVNSFQRGDKPIEVLLVENDSQELKQISEKFELVNISYKALEQASEALDMLQLTPFDIAVLHLHFPVGYGYEFLDKLSSESNLKMRTVFAYVDQNISEKQLDILERLEVNIITKSMRSAESLVDEVRLFVNQLNNQSELDKPLDSPSVKQKQKQPTTVDDNGLDGKVVLLVDDDMRNTFALAKVLRKNRLIVKLASSGQQSIEMLEEHSDIDLVLMDIMMPEMDGYEAMRQIRKNPAYKDLAIIAVTANAMPGDKEKCIDAGANDYLAKPVDLDQLLTMMKLWIPTALVV